MNAVTIKWDSKGKTTQVFGPEVDAKKQAQYVKKLKIEGLDEGIELVEMWSRGGGFIMAAKRSKEQMISIRKEGEEAKKAFNAKKEKAAKDLAEDAKKQNKVKTVAEAVAEMRKANGAKDPKKTKKSE